MTGPIGPEIVRSESAVLEGKPDPGPRRRRIFLTANLALLLATCGWLRLHRLDTVPGINGDEAYIPVQAEGLLSMAGLRPLQAVLDGGQPRGRVAYTPEDRPKLFVPSGKLIDVCTLAYYLGVLLVFRPSFWLLRSFPLVVGVATIVLAHALGSRAFGRRVGLIAAVTFAVLPIALAYSRFAWESCQIPLFGVLALFLACTGRPWALVAVAPVGFSIHPTNILLIPLLAGLLIAHRVEVRGVRRADLIRALDRLLLSLLGALAVGLVVVLVFKLEIPYRTWLDRSEWLAFARWTGRFLSGSQIYENIIAPGEERTALIRDLACWTTGAVMLLLGFPGLVRRRRWIAIVLVVGALLQPWLLFLVGGHKVVHTPGLERYAMFLVAPLVFGFAYLVDSAVGSLSSGRVSVVGRLMVVCLSLVAWAGAGDFYRNEFLILPTLSAHRTYRTADLEPKAEALRIAREDLASRELPPDRQGPSILVEDFWLGYPMAFLNWPDRMAPLKPLSIDGIDDLRRERGAFDDLRAGNYVIPWSGEALDRWLREACAGKPVRLIEVPGPAGRPLITIYRWTGETGPDARDRQARPQAPDRG